MEKNSTNASAISAQDIPSPLSSVQGSTQAKETLNIQALKEIPAQFNEAKTNEIIWPKLGPFAFGSPNHVLGYNILMKEVNIHKLEGKLNVIQN